jgi:flagellar L-ring protein FlgH
MNHNVLIIVFIASFFISACSSTNEMNKSVQIEKKPEYQIPLQPEPPRKKQKGSLYQGQSYSLFADRKDLQLGDIVFITIKEDQGEITTRSERTSSLNDDEKKQSGGSLDVPDTSLSIISKSIDALNKVLGIGYTLPSRSGTFSAESESISELDFKDNLSAVVTEQYRNGNYLLEGLKQIVIHGQKHTLKISGVLNPRELQGNTIASEKLANLKVIYFKDGDEQEYMEKPWGTKLLETISPF